MAYMPATTVEIAFNAGYLTPAADRVWTDVTDYVELQSPLSITRGRADELAEVPPSHLEVTLDNRDGRFTPDKTDGAYYPNVKKGRPIRVRVTLDSGEVYDRFAGYVDEWPVEWPNTTDTLATVAVSASSRMARLAAGAEMRSIIEQEYLSDTPAAYYTLGEPEGATVAGNTAETLRPDLAQDGSGTAVTFGTQTGPGTDSMPSPLFSGGKYLRVNTTVAPTAGEFGLAACFLTSSASEQVIVSVSRTIFAKGTAAAVRVTSAGKLEATRWAHVASGGSSTYTQLYSIVSSATVSDGATHHAEVTESWDGSTATASLYLDGALVGSATTAYAAPEFFYLTVGGGVLGTGVDRPFTGTLSHVAVFESALAATRVADHSASALTGFSGETSDARIRRYARYAGTPAAEVSAETGLSTSIARVDTTGVTPIAAMLDVAETESGVLFDARDGGLTFQARSHRYNAAAAFELSVARQEVEADLVAVLDDQFLLNDISASRPNGVNVRAVSRASMDDYGPYRKSLDLLTTSDAEVADAANWLLHRYAEPRIRFDAVSVNLLALAGDAYGAGVYGDGLYGSDLTVLLDADIGTRFTLAGLPAQAPVSSLDFFIEGTTETIGHETYLMTFTVSSTALSDVWQLDSATYSQLDESTVLAY